MIRSIAAALALAAGFTAHAQFLDTFEVLSVWTPPAGEEIHDMAGWDGVVYAHTRILPNTSNLYFDARLHELDMSNPQAPAQFDVRDFNADADSSSNEDCTYIWEEPLLAKNGLISYAWAFGCEVTFGDHSFPTLSFDNHVRSVGPPPHEESISFYGQDGPPVPTVIGDQFIALATHIYGTGPHAGEDAYAGSMWADDEIYADGDRFYVVGRSTLRAYDVSSPGSPAFLYEAVMDEPPYEIRDGIGYASSDASGAFQSQMWDLTPATGPVLVYEEDQPLISNSGTAYDGFLYQMHENGIRVIDASDPFNPVVVAKDQTIGEVENLGFAPGIVYARVGNEILTLRVTPAACSNADLAEPFGVLDLGDIQAFVAGFMAQDAASDLAEPFGVFDLADVQVFATGFVAGCP